MASKQPLDIREGYKEKYGFSVKVKSAYETGKGLNEGVIKEISNLKAEPEWLRQFRLKALAHFQKRPLPLWGADLTKINFDEITYYVKPTDEKQATKWEDLPPEIKNTFEKLGIPEAERKFLGGVGAQFESENVYHSLHEQLKNQGVVFVDPDTGLNPTEEKIKQMGLDKASIERANQMFRKWFGKVVPIEDNKFAALNSAVFSGGSFIYVPPNVDVALPLQAYFRINRESVGQFERTLIIVDKGSKLHYIEGCLPHWEEVSCGDDLRPITEIEAGNIVLNSEGKETKVVKTMIRPFKGDLINITPVSVGNAFSLTPEHPVLAIKRSKVAIGSKIKPERRTVDYNAEKLMKTKPEFIDAGKLEEGDFIVFPINQVSIDNTLFTEPLLTALGYYLAEGNLSKINGCDAVVLNFNEWERENIEDAKRTIFSVTGKIPSEFNEKEKHGLRLTVYSKELYELCEKHCRKYAGKKKLSKEIMDLPPEKQIILFKSYFKGDGNITKRKPLTFRAMTTSRQLAFQLQEVLARQGIYASINIRKAYKEKMKDGRVINHRQLYIVYYANGKRANAVKRVGNYFLVPIKKVKKSFYNDLVYNFQVNREPNTYLVKGFAVHNCTAPMYSDEKHSLHSAVVEIVALEGATVRYTTLQNWSNNVLNLVTKRAFAYEGANVEWVDANIGCIAEGTLVFSNPDVKPIESINSGDNVFTFNEQTKDLEVKKVVATKFTGIKPVYEIKLEDGKRTVDATLNHPFLTVVYYPDRPSKLGRYELCWKKLEELNAGDFLVVTNELPDVGKSREFLIKNKKRTALGRNQYGAEYLVDTTYKYNDVNIPTASTEDLMWLLGVLIGDGNVIIAKSKKTDVNRYGRVIFSIPRKDNAREKLLELMKNVFKLSKFEERKDGVTITYNSLLLAEFLEKIGFKGDAHTKRVPKWVYTLPIRQKLSFIAGYLESDGTIKGNNGRLKTCNKELLDDLKVLCITCGIEVNKIKEFTETKKIAINKNALEKTYKHYVMHISKLLKLREFLAEKNKGKVPSKSEKEFKEWHLTRTRRIKLPKHLSLYKITGISKKGDVATFDIEVDGAHNFVANGVVVHNSKLTMKYPSVFLRGPRAKADILSVAFAGRGQHQDAGGKVVHIAPNTSSTIVSKSISKDAGRTSYRGLVRVAKGATGVKSSVRCDALILDDVSRSDTYPYMEIDEEDAAIAHEATVGKISTDKIFYLMSRGLSESEAVALIVLGFMHMFTKELPMEYAVEFNRLIQLEMKGAVG